MMNPKLDWFLEAFRPKKLVSNDDKWYFVIIMYFFGGFLKAYIENLVPLYDVFGLFCGYINKRNKFAKKSRWEVTQYIPMITIN